MAAPEKPMQGWETFLGLLSQPARSSLRREVKFPGQPDPAPPSAESDDYALWYAQLSASAQEAVGELAPAEEADAAPDPEAARYFLVESEDGEFHRVRLFKTAEALGRRIAFLDGEDMGVVPAVGMVLEFTRGPQRYLYLPDGRTAMALPLYEGGPIRLVDADLIRDTIEAQEDGFLGPDELANTEAPYVPLPGKKPVKVKDDEDDEDDDDDDDEEDD